MLCFPHVVRPLVRTGGRLLLQASEPILIEVVATEEVCATCLSFFGGAGTSLIYTFVHTYAHSYGTFIYITVGKGELAG